MLNAAKNAGPTAMTDKPDVTISRAGPGATQLLRAMNAMFGRVFDETETYEGAPPDEAYLARLLDNDQFVALVARAGEAVIGGLAAYELPKYEQARSELYIYDLAVEEAYRRQGVAMRLIEALHAIARERGAWVVFVQADHGDDAAIALYSKLGRREDVLHFDLDPK